jgi:hypothetical protein
MTPFSRRDFARLVALSGSAALVPASAWARGDVLDRFDATAAPLPHPTVVGVYAGEVGISRTLEVDRVVGPIRKYLASGV